MPDWLNDIIYGCGWAFILIIIGFLISAAVVCIKDAIENHHDKKFGYCPLNPESQICDGRKYVGCYIHDKETVNCFMCPRFKNEKDKIPSGIEPTHTPPEAHYHYDDFTRWFCPNCDIEVELHQKFCKNCGQKLKWSE